MMKPFSVCAIVGLGLGMTVQAAQPGFPVRPSAKRVGDGFHIAFEVAKPTDFEVAVLDAGGKPCPQVPVSTLIALDDAAEPHALWLVTRFWHSGTLRKLVDRDNQGSALLR